MFVALTDLGRVRADNEDRWVVREEAGLYLLSDGAGGLPAGEVAAEMAVDQLAELLEIRLQNQKHTDSQSITNILKKSILEVNNHIVNDGLMNPAHKDMAATIVILYQRDKQIWIAHLGDSRAYQYAGKKLRLLTQDHAVGSMLTQCLGLGGPVQPEVCEVEARPGSRFLLCSDGLHGMLTDDLIAKILRQDEPLERVGKLLISQANEAGGYDNITLILLDIDE